MAWQVTFVSASQDEITALLAAFLRIKGHFAAFYLVLVAARHCNSLRKLADLLPRDARARELVFVTAVLECNLDFSVAWVARLPTEFIAGMPEGAGLRAGFLTFELVLVLLVHQMAQIVTFVSTTETSAADFVASSHHLELVQILW